MMTNEQARNSELVIAEIETPVGTLLAGSNSEALCFLEFTEPSRIEAQLKSIGRRHPSSTIVQGDNKHTKKLRKELSAYFAGKLREFTVPLAYPGSPFQMKVWNELLRIPYGETISYEELASRVISPAASRAVGTANGQNPIAIVIPCHRVINKSGKLGGYGGGVWRKQLLLDLESQDVTPRLF